MITVLIGVLINNARISDLNARMTSLENRMSNMEGRLTNLDNKWDMRFDMLIGRVIEIDNRLTRIEAQRR